MKIKNVSRRGQDLESADVGLVPFGAVVECSEEVAERLALQAGLWAIVTDDVPVIDDNTEEN